MSKEQKIRVLRVQPNLPPDVVYLDNELHALQAAVGGLIEIINLEAGTCLLLNEEGKLIGLEGNRRFGQDVLVGVFYIIGSDDSNGDLTSLPEDKISKYSKVFFFPETITAEEVEDSIRVEFYTF